MKHFLIFFILLMVQTFCTGQDQSKLLYKVEGKESAYPRLSADGNKILYQSNAKGNWQLLIMDIGAGTHTAVMEDAYNNNFPDWRYDNAWIAFTSDRDGNEEIYVMRTDGQSLRRITNDPGRDIHPYFSPDGRYLLFNSTRNNGSFDVYRYSFETGETERITDTPDDETCARYSPDMHTILLLQNSTTKDDVMLMDPKTNEMRNLSSTPGVRDGWPMFSNDNQWVYYSSFETGAYCIYRIRLDGTDKTKLTAAKSNEEDARVCVAKDERFMIYNKRLGNTIEIRYLELNA